MRDVRVQRVWPRPHLTSRRGPTAEDILRRVALGANRSWRSPALHKHGRVRTSERAGPGFAAWRAVAAGGYGGSVLSIRRAHGVTSFVANSKGGINPAVALPASAGGAAEPRARCGVGGAGRIGAQNHSTSFRIIHRSVICPYQRFVPSSSLAPCVRVWGRASASGQLEGTFPQTACPLRKESQILINGARSGGARRAQGQGAMLTDAVVGARSVRAHVLRASVPSPTVSGLTVFPFHVPKLVKACLA